MKISTLSPNVVIIGAVAGFGLYLLYGWFGDGTDKGPGNGPGGGSLSDSLVNKMEQAAQKKNEQISKITDNLPFSPPWWWDKIQKSYNDIGN